MSGQTVDVNPSDEKSAEHVRQDGHAGGASARSLRGLDLLNFLLADVQTGVGPFMAIYLQKNHWNPQQVGFALTLGGIAGIATQTPFGALIDRIRSKRFLIGAGVVALGTGSAILAFYPSYWPVVLVQILVGGMSSIFNPAIAAVALGLVGQKLFDVRQGRNQSFNAAGNVFAAAMMGLLGYKVSLSAAFLFVAVMAGPTLLSMLLIKPDEIDYEQSRGARDGVDGGRAGWREMLKDRSLLIFLACAVLFHFANAAMLPLLGEMLSQNKGAASSLFMSACIVTTQVVVTLLAWPVGKLADRWGRKKLLLIGFAVLPLRGLLYTMTHNTYLLVGIQVLDGVGAGIFNVVAILAIADLTRGTGRFNVTQGAIFTAVGIGAALSQVIAGAIVKHWSYNAGFIFLAAVAGIAVAVLAMFMPETRGMEPGREMAAA
ncbi:MAG TPA: MFS transporter [Tepidisphaeraceae bacterium]